MKLKKILKGYKPLAVSGGSLILSRGRRLYRSDLDLNSPQYLTMLPNRTTRHRLAGVRVVDRVLRLSVSSMVAVSSEIAFCIAGSEIWRVELDTGAVSLDFTIPLGRKALSLTVKENEALESKSVLFGDYFMNPAGPTLRTQGHEVYIDHVNVWTRPVDGLPKWTVLGSFSATDVDHIHNIVPSRDGKEMFALVGDTGNNVGFWKWNSAKKCFTPFQTGSQMNRSTWAFATGAELIYATDTQLEQNYLVRSGLDADSEPRIVAPIAGSSIYWGRISDALVFSSSVEPGLPSGNFLRDILERRAGPGINGNAAKIYILSLDDERLEEIFSADKDPLPHRLAQFGTFMFPTGMDELKDRVFAYGNAIKGFDNVCMLFTRD